MMTKWRAIILIYFPFQAESISRSRIAPVKKNLPHYIASMSRNHSTMRFNNGKRDSTGNFLFRETKSTKLESFTLSLFAFSPPKTGSRTEHGKRFERDGRWWALFREDSTTWIPTSVMKCDHWTSKVGETKARRNLWKTGRKKGFKSSR